ncbi:MAG: NifB/NifX family molybdenum-iron cluster-binding protein [Elusimicrobiales bacterium]
MKIGITLDENKGLESKVSMHFGQCGYFMIAEIENGQIKKSEIIENKSAHGGGGCKSVPFLLSYDIKYLISGGMGAGAKTKLENSGIKVFYFDGKANEAIENFINDNLKPMDICKENHHDHGHTCH